MDGWASKTRNFLNTVSIILTIVLFNVSIHKFFSEVEEIKY